jgi:hypothetical protein
MPRCRMRLNPSPARWHSVSLGLIAFRTGWPEILNQVRIARRTRPHMVDRVPIENRVAASGCVVCGVNCTCSCGTAFQTVKSSQNAISSITYWHQRSYSRPARPPGTGSGGERLRKLSLQLAGVRVTTTMITRRPKSSLSCKLYFPGCMSINPASPFLVPTDLWKTAGWSTSRRHAFRLHCRVLKQLLASLSPTCVWGGLKDQENRIELSTVG